MSAHEEAFYRASSLQLIWWKFKRHRVALASAIFLVALYLMLPFVEVIAPYGLATRNAEHLSAPPQGVHIMHEGSLRTPFVYPYAFKFNLDTFRANTSRTGPSPTAALSLPGAPYAFWAVIQSRFISSARRRAARSFWSAPTSSAATSSRASSMGRASHSRWACSASRCRS